MTQRQHLLNIRHELDELIHLVLQQHNITEREMILARIDRARSSIADAILELDAVELSGYDC